MNWGKRLRIALGFGLVGCGLWIGPSIAGFSAAGNGSGNVPSHLENLHDNFPIWGIDISHHQSWVDWEELMNTESPDFVILKATEGVTHHDKMFSKHWSALKKYEVTRGAYHFFSYSTSGALQAREYIKKVTLKKGDFPPVLDLEFRRKMPADKRVIREIKAWVKVIEQHYGVKPILYAGEVYYRRYLKGNFNRDYPLWLCEYYKTPQLPWVIWQVSESHSIAGIRGPVDKNVFYGDRVDLDEITMK